MKTPTYPSEPLPLKKLYPRLRSNRKELVMAIGLIIGLSSVMRLFSDTGAPFGRFVITITVPIIAVIFLFSLLNTNSEWGAERRWRKAFLQNNADLKLDRRVILRVMRYFRQNTAYANVNFRKVATEIAKGLRMEHPYKIGYLHTTFSYEAVCAYRFFKTGKGKPIPTYNPVASNKKKKRLART